MGRRARTGQSLLTPGPGPACPPLGGGAFTMSGEPTFQLLLSLYTARQGGPLAAAPGPHRAQTGSPPRRQGSMETCPQLHGQLLGRPAGSDEGHRRASFRAQAGTSRCIALAPGMGPKAVTCRGAGVLAPHAPRVRDKLARTFSTGKGQGVGTKVTHTSSIRKSINPRGRHHHLGCHLLKKKSNVPVVRALSRPPLSVYTKHTGRRNRPKYPVGA